MGIEWILKRRSIRKYTDEIISPETVRSLLEAGMAAPSARNVQPWHFIVVTDRHQLNALADAHPYGGMLAHAPLAIAVAGDITSSGAYWIQDCSAATENILLAASALGLGAVWLGVTPREDRIRAVDSVLSVPDGFQTLCVISLGYPAEEKEARTQYREDRIHQNSW